MLAKSVVFENVLRRCSVVCWCVEVGKKVVNSTTQLLLG